MPPTRRDLDDARERRSRGGDRMARGADREAWQKRANTIRDKLPILRIIDADVALEKSGKKTMQGLCPFHGEATPSFTVYFEGTHKIKVGFFICYGCGAKGDVIHYVMKRQNLEWTAAIQLLESENGLALLSSTPAPRPAPQVMQADEKRKIDRAQRIWAESIGLGAGGVVDLYLRGRAIVPPADYGIGDAQVNGGWPVDLRFQERCWHDLERREFPAMIAAIRNHAGDLLTVHRTYLARHADGSWTKAAVAKAKLVVGTWPPGFVLLGPVVDKMIGGEGLETSLSAMQLSKRSGLSFVNSGRMATTDLPFLCDDFIYAADKGGKGRAGEVRANDGAAANRTARKIQVKLPNLPIDKCDFNDVVMHRAGLLQLPDQAAAPAPKPRAPQPDRAVDVAAAIFSPTARREAERDMGRSEIQQTALELKRIEREAWTLYSYAAVQVDDAAPGEAREKAERAFAAAEETWKTACRRYEAAASRRVA